jgi:hypothetical protein
LHSVILLYPMPFLTKIDSNAAVKGSRDPLGVQAIWTQMGRKIVPNLTTVSTSLRDFTTTILGYAFAEELAGKAEPLDVFLRWEQWAAYARSQDDPRTFVREHQILSNQKTYGLWGLYSMPSRASGLLEEKGVQLTSESRNLVEREYWPAFSSGAGTRAAKIASKLSVDPFKLNLTGEHTPLVKAVAKVLASPGKRNLSEMERDFYTHHLLHRTPLQKNAVETLPKELKESRTLSPVLLREWSKRARRDPELAERLDDIRVVESLLAPSVRLFSFLLGEDKRPIGEIAKDIRKQWDTAFRSLETERLESLGSSLRRAGGTELESERRWLRTAHSLQNGAFEEAIRSLCAINAEVMQNRGGAAWIQIENNRLRVHVAESSRPLPEAAAIGSLWEHSYFLDSLAIVASDLQA